MTIAKRTYRFDCPKCKNALEAKPEEVKIGLLKARFKCPICEKERTVARTRISEITDWNI